jgi:predicted dithiol-disulfide oxidoreductase (DUF899 family)
MTTATTIGHRVVSKEQWTTARKAHLAREKELTRLRDELAAERQNLPWTRVDKPYTFDTPAGPRTLADLFGDRSQLVVYHFMFGPDWNEGCPSCSYVADHLDGTLPHLAARDVALIVVSRAPLPKLQAFKSRLGWRFPWVSSYGTDFNTDFGVSFTKEEMARGAVNYNYALQAFPSEEAPGASVFYKDADGAVYHTYSTYGRGVEPLLGTYTLLDMAPKGRDEAALPFGMAWVRYHDRYETNQFADADKPYWPNEDHLAAATAATTAAPAGCCASKTAATTAEVRS